MLNRWTCLDGNYIYLLSPFRQINNNNNMLMNNSNNMNQLMMRMFMVSTAELFPVRAVIYPRLERVVYPTAPHLNPGGQGRCPRRSQSCSMLALD